MSAEHVRGTKICPICRGKGAIPENKEYEYFTRDTANRTCLYCMGKGRVSNEPKPQRSAATQHPSRRRNEGRGGAQRRLVCPFCGNELRRYSGKIVHIPGQDRLQNDDLCILWSYRLSDDERIHFRNGRWPQGQDGLPIESNNNKYHINTAKE